MATVKEIADRMGFVGFENVRQAPQASALSPGTQALVEATERRKMLLAVKIDEGSVEELEGNTEATKTKAETEKLKAEIDLLKVRSDLAGVRETVEGSGSKTEGVMGAFLEMLSDEKRALLKDNADLRDRMFGSLSLEVQALKDDLRQAARGIAPDTDGHMPIAQQITDLKSVRDAILDIFPPPLAQTATSDVNEAIKLYELKESHELRMAQLGLQRVEIENKSKLEWARFEEERRRSDTTGKFIEAYGPAVIDAFKTGGFFRGSGNGAGAAPVSGLAEIINMSCPNCETAIEVAPDAVAVRCPNDECSKFYQIRR